MEKLRLEDIYWDRIYLYFKLNADCNNQLFFLATLNNKIVHQFFAEKNIIKINITNIGNQEMIQNGNWYLKQKIGDEYVDIPIAVELGMKLNTLDKVYRYGGNTYAYIVTFSPKRTEDLFCQIAITFMMRNSNPKKRNLKAEGGSFKFKIKKRINYFITKSYNWLFKLTSLLTIKNGKRILLLSEIRVPISGNLLALDDRLKERNLDKEFKISYYFKKTKSLSTLRLTFEWYKLAYLCGKQDFIFIDDYCPFFKYIDIDKDKSITFIQVWHAGLGFKAVGYGRFGTGGKAGQYPYSTTHRKYDYTIVGGESLRESYAESFGIDIDNCLPYGLMRHDKYLNPDRISQFKENFYSNYPMFKNKRIILFAPTFRGNGASTAYYPYEQLDLDQIYKMCGEDSLFVIKVHPFIKELLEVPEQYKDRIIEFSTFGDLESLFYISDILITDYSSNIYEFALFKKPIIFFAFDKEEYEFTRQVHSKLDDCATGKVCSTFTEVIKTIQNEDFEMDKLYDSLQTNYKSDSSLSSDIVIDKLLLKQDK